MSEIAGVILAGGRGQRMGALGEEYPKALLPVGDRPLLAHQLGLLRRLGVRRVWVVVGYRSQDFLRVVGDGRAYGVTVRYVDQGATLGSAHAFGRVQPFVRSPLLLLLGDYYFSTDEPERLVRRLQSGSSAMVVKQEPDRRLVREACAVEVDGDGRVVEIVEKPSEPPSDLKGCGFYALQPQFFDAVRRTPRTALRDEYELSVSLDLYVKAGHPLYAEDILTWDTNLTEPRDLLQCSAHWLRQQGRQEWVAPDAEVEAGIERTQTVVGAGARVAGAGPPGRASLEEVIVFPGARLEVSEPLRRTLVTPNRRIEC
jgi:dTDP-glucose pyrophosphorylase